MPAQAGIHFSSKMDPRLRGGDDSFIGAMMSQIINTTCCIVGGGPAGIMLGFLLARRGIEVAVLEKHGDFFRDFRGDTIHPSTLEVMNELGLLDDFLKRPHEETSILKAFIGDDEVTMADFSHLPTKCRFIAFMPQWDFLNFIAEKAKAYPSFKLLMQTEAKELIEESGKIIGVRAATPEGEIEIRAKLMVGADGRHSMTREKSGFEIVNRGAPMDILWMRISRMPADPHYTLGRVGSGKMLAMINRNTYWQCAYVIPKGGFEQVKAAGLEAFRRNLAEIAPFLGGRVNELQSWDDIKLLTVAVDRLRKWQRPGMLCIGDAAHAMSPIGGVGINLAIQDAIAAANILAAPLKAGKAGLRDLEAVQARREWPTRMTQAMQLFIQKHVITNVLQGTHKPRAPFVLNLLNKVPLLQRIPARLIGMGFRPEHVRK